MSARLNCWSAAIGMALWLARIAGTGISPRSEAWAETLLLLAPLVLIPLGLELVRLWPGERNEKAQSLFDIAQWFQFPAAVMLLLAFLLPRGIHAALCSLPWLMTTLWLALVSSFQWRERLSQRDISAVPLAAAFLLLPVGATWLLLSRLGARPLEFSDDIVLLTAIHFHYAGFVLPLLAALCILRHSTRLSQWTGVLVASGVPLVAVGITITQLGGHFIFEAVSALWLSTVGLLLASEQWRLAGSSRMQSGIARWCLRISSLSLAGGMLLSIFYGVRGFGIAPHLDIAAMRAVHGSMNALGFALLSLWGWHCEVRALPMQATRGR